MTFRLNVEESYHFWRLFTSLNFQNIRNFKTFELRSTLNESSVLSVLRSSTRLAWQCLLLWHTSNNLSEKAVKGLKFFIEGRYCSLADFSGICIQPTWLYRENYNKTVDSISSRDRKFGVMVMESTDVRRIHSKEKISFCKEWCVYFSYTHRLSKRKRNWHFVCVPLWLCFVKLRTNILGQATCCSLLWFASTIKPEQDYVQFFFYNLEVWYQS